MLADNVLALIASCAIKKGYNNQSITWNGNGYAITTIEQSGHHIIVEIVKNGNKTYMFCQEGSQNANDYWVDLQAMCDDKKKKVKGKSGKVTKKMWDEYKKYRSSIEAFYNEYKSKGDVVFAGHSLGGAVVGIAAGMMNVKAILLAPVPFVGHSNWSNNYSVVPKTYVNPSDPCCSDKVGISWGAANHIGKTWIYNGSGYESHKIASFISYFSNNCGFNIL